jgi:hypothetical protein
MTANTELQHRIADMLHRYEKSEREARRTKAARPRRAHRPATFPPHPATPAPVTDPTLRAMLQRFDRLIDDMGKFIRKLEHELVVTAKERREGNSILELMLKKVTRWERVYGLIEEPTTPTTTRRRPIDIG